MSEQGSDPMGTLDLATRLEVGATGFGEGTYPELRVAGADWIRAGGDGGEDLGEALVALEPLLSRSYLLGQPNLAGMGVSPWDLSVATPAEAMISRVTERTRRMIGGGALAGLEGPAEASRPDDQHALERGADLVEALQRLDAAAVGLPPEVPLAAQVARLRAELSGRLSRERRHHRGLDKALGQRDLADPATLDALRGGRPAEPTPARAVVAAPPRASAYDAALEATLAHELRAEPGAVDHPRLADVRQRLQQATEAALAQDAASATARRLTEQARRLMAEEVALTGGRPAAAGAVDTVSLRRALADRPTRTPRPQDGDVAPRADLPEVPIFSSRGEKSKIVGYLRADERTLALQRTATHVQVAVPGSGRPGWIPAGLLGAPALAARGPLLPPGTGPARVAPAGAGGVPELARLAALVARETGQSAAALLAQALQDPELAQDLPRRAARKDRGEAMAIPAGPLRIERVQVDGLPGQPEAARIVDAALSRLPGVLERRLADATVRERIRGSAGELRVPLTVDRQGDPRVQADLLADRMADALVREGAAEVGTLRLGVRTTGGAAPDRTLLARLATGDTDAIATELAAEQKTLDTAQQARLARFFGEDFKDVLIFAGPMAGALARSLEAEAVTHGQMIFFDPLHFRPDTPRGEALMAHELAHTRQAADVDVRVKEAEALATEAAFLDWVRPGAAPFTFAQDLPLDPTAPAAAAASDVPAGALRAASGRQVDQMEGPRKDVAKDEKRAEVVMQAVRELLDLETDLEGQRVGALRRIFNRLV